jgi:hypothetical protein
MAPWSRHSPAGSLAPAITGEQVPALAASAQETQLPVHVVRQQTPCAQIPETHSVPSAQEAPGCLRPHEPFWHTNGGEMQSASVVQVLLQTLVPQRNGEHEVDGRDTHVPAPSQLDDGVAVVFMQVASRHEVPAAYL